MYEMNYRHRCSHSCMYNREPTHCCRISRLAELANRSAVEVSWTSGRNIQHHSLFG